MSEPVFTRRRLITGAAALSGIKVEPVTLTWGPPYYTKLQLAAVGGRPPDVAISHATRLGSLAPAGLVMELTPDLLEKHGITPDKFEPAQYAQVMALAILGALQLLIAFLLFQRQIVQGISNTGLKG